MPSMGEIWGELGLDSRKFVSGARNAKVALGDATTKVKAFGGKIKTMGRDLAASNPAIGRMNDLLTSTAGQMVLAGGAVAAVVGTLRSFTNETAQLGGKLVDLSSKTTLSLRSLQELGFAGEQVGVGIDIVSSAVLRLGRRIGAELPEATKWMGKLGLETQAVLSMDASTQFSTVASAIAKLSNPSEQAAAAMGIFGDQGLQILPLIRSDVEATVESFNALGGVIDDEVLRAGKELTDHWTNMEAVFVSFKAQVASETIPVLNELFTLMEKIAQSNAGGTGEPGFMDRVFSSASTGGVFVPGTMDRAATELGLLNQMLTDFSATLSTIPDEPPGGLSGVALGEGLGAAMDAGDALALLNQELGPATEKGSVLTEQLKKMDSVSGGLASSVNGLVSGLDDAWSSLGQLPPIVDAITGETFPAMNEGFVEVGEQFFERAFQIEEAARRMGLTTRSAMAESIASQKRDLETLRSSGEVSYQAIADKAKEVAELEMLYSQEKTTFGLDQGMQMLSGTGQIFSQLAGKSKAFAIAGAIIDTAKAVTMTMRQFGWPLGIPFAAAAAAAGAIQIAKIKGTDPGFRGGTPNLDYANFGRETSTSLHGEEAVIPRAGVGRLARDIATAAPFSGGNQISIVNNFNAGGRKDADMLFAEFIDRLRRNQGQIKDELAAATA